MKMGRRLSNIHRVPPFFHFSIFLQHKKDKGKIDIHLFSSVLLPESVTPSVAYGSLQRCVLLWSFYLRDCTLIFLGIAPSVLNITFSLSHNIHPLILINLYISASYSSCQLNFQYFKIIENLYKNNENRYILSSLGSFQKINLTLYKLFKAIFFTIF